MMHSVTAVLISTVIVTLVAPQEIPDPVLPQTANVSQQSGCTQEEQQAFLSTLPNAAVCGASLATVSTPPLSNPLLLASAFENLCTKDCGEVYVNFQESVCEDELAAESIRLFCTPSNGSAAVGAYCRFALADILDPSLLTSLDYCDNFTEEAPCAPRCRDALLDVKHEMGCCYQNVYNNTLCVNNSLLLSAGLITPSEFAALRALNDPAGNPWIRCGIEPPKRCGPPVFKPPTPSKCALQDHISFIAFLPNPGVCGSSLETVFTPPRNDSLRLAYALEDVCTSDCGGVYANHLKTDCGDELGYESLHIFCTFADQSAAVGTHCRYAVADVFDSTLFDLLFSCYNITTELPCPSDCRESLVNLKAQIGCCYQNVYNNTRYLVELFNAGFLTPSQLIGFEDLNNPAGNPWTLCEIEPPQRCERPPFTLPPTPLKCSLPDQRAYVLTLSNASACGTSIGIAYLPPTNDSKTLSDAVDYMCTNECGGVYANYQRDVCKDELGAESLRVFCTPTNGTATVGSFCYYAAGNMLHPSLLTTLSSCHSYSNEVPCSDECRDALLNLTSQIGCCYQNVYNNTVYNTLLLVAGFINKLEFNAYQDLNKPAGNPWTRCKIKPPQKCEPSPFKQPEPPKCTLQDQVAFISTFPNAAVCGPSIATIFTPPVNDTMTLTHAVMNVCTNDCGGMYANYLENVCNDKLGAESLKAFCTPTNGSAAVGEYCRYAVADILDTSIFDGLFSCYINTAETPCVENCRAALLNLKAQVGCCYQNIYNNTRYYTQLLYAGFITPREFTGFRDLNDPTGNPWTFCGIEPPQKCEPSPFKQQVSHKCTLTDQVAFVSTFPNAAVCGPTIATIFTPPVNDTMTLMHAVTNVCTNDCGGMYANYLENVCNDELGAESLKAFCTPTNGSAVVGDYCRYAIVDILGTSIFDDLFSCYITTAETPCVENCRAALLNLKAQVGCCYQNIYNNTRYYTQLLYAGFITPHEFTGFRDLNDPTGNPWIFCEIEPPQKCVPPPFKPSVRPKCTVENQTAFLLSLPNAEVCAPSLTTVAVLDTDDSKALTIAFDNACMDDCGGVFTNFMDTTCSDPVAAESIRLFCTKTNGSATVGQFCRHANFDVLDPSLFRALATCGNNSVEVPCTAECREGLLNLKSSIGCCYQNVYNNTPYFVHLLNDGIITPSFFTEYQHFNDPASNPWIACNVTTPQHCPGDSFSDGCPPGTYRQNLTCQRCPANTNTTLTGGDATICPCLKGYFRTSQEGPSESCSSPPSTCRNIQVLQRSDTRVTMQWAKPVNTGRDDYYYQIEYGDGETTGMHVVVDKLDYVQEVVSNLKPDTSYMFTVTVNNGVSDQDSGREYLRRCELTTTTMEGRPSAPHGVQTFCSAIGWRIPLKSNGKIISFDIQLRLGVDDIITLSTGSDRTFIAVEDDYQKIGTMIQVRARTSAGAGNWSQKTPLACPSCECTTPTQPSQGVYYILGGKIYGNNSVVSLDRVEGEEGALTCRTDKVDCCGAIPNRFGQFYYPNRVQVPVNNAGQGFYRNRGDQVVRLNRREGITSPTGKFHCEIPDASGENQNLYITLV